jgi:AcrR family transcriptional regulator
MLEAARARFTRDGYDGVGVREIAADVGVNAALVIRYFGSKEALFAQALAQQFDIGAVLAGERAELGERLVRLVLAKDDVPGALDPVIALLRSATNEPAAAMLRDSIDAQFITPLAAWLDGEQAMSRAALIAAALLGLAVTRSVIRSAPLVTSDVEHLVGQAAPMIQHYIDGPRSS